MGTAYEFQEQYARAEQCYAESVELNPHSAQAQAVWGQALIRSEDLPRALAAWKKAVELQPDWFEMHHDIARLQLSLGNAFDATLHLRAAQRLRPEDREVQIELAQLATSEASFDSSPTELAPPTVADKNQGDRHSGP